jgi:hypothetical protein
MLEKILNNVNLAIDHKTLKKLNKAEKDKIRSITHLYWFMLLYRIPESSLMVLSE